MSTRDSHQYGNHAQLPNGRGLDKDLILAGL